MKRIRKFLDRFDLDRMSARSVMIACLIIGVVVELIFIGLFSFSRLMTGIGFMAGLLMALAGVVVYSAYARCPHCGKYIDDRHADAVYCTDCGGKLD